MIVIDGSFGEGGGQILRTSLSLSCLLKTPFRIFNIRRRRKKPGLMPQHLACVKAMTLISNATVRYDVIGSQELVFEPSDVKAGDYFFDIGTAGSTSLVLQTLLPCLIFAGSSSRVSLKGGTHVPFSPSFHYLSEIFIPMLNRIGLTLNAKIENCGFYPKGGGKISVEVIPSQKTTGLNLLERGPIKKITGISAVGNLPISIAERQRAAALKLLQRFDAEIETTEVQSIGRGTFLFLMAASAVVAGFSSIGERGKKAEIVGREAAQEFLDYYQTGSCLDSHLSDQIVLYLALAKTRSEFTTSCISNHLITNLRAIEQFLAINYAVEGDNGLPGKIIIGDYS